MSFNPGPVNKVPSGKKQVPSKYLGPVTPAQLHFIETLVFEHRFTVTLEVVGKDQMRATVLSKDENKLAWIEWMFNRFKDVTIAKNAALFANTAEHPLDSLPNNLADDCRGK